ncbi:trace amine-associated receptor 7a-like [Malaclemys terrapin pileata]|uniref:trace amine-associated receptor 7a-like n=1 Tax=Malaclemys terrapin pileata TaxID=2991368 RepID=UPI0023A7FDB6|nr:trace amine-associated receptor 7a-like [Malaclemys terrapin pileata]
MTSALLENEEARYCFENINGSCHKTSWSSGIRITLYVVLGFLTILTLGGNLMVIITVAYFKQLHSPTNILLASLACADFCLGLTVLPFSSIRSVETCWYFGEILCRFHSSLELSFCYSSIFHLCFISVDRYVAVTDPLIYPLKFTVPVSGMFIAVAWIFSLVYSFSVVFSGANDKGIQELVNALSCVGSCQLVFNKTWVVVSALLYLIPFFTMIALYSKIFAVAKRQARMIEMMSNKIQSSGNYSDRGRKRERKAAKTLGIAAIAFLVCWSPFFISVIIDAFLNFITPPLLFDIMVWFTYSNSAINPLIYSLFYPWFRKAMKVIVSFKMLRLDCSTMNLFTN